MTFALLAAVVAGAFIGLSLGALGGGGSILAVPVLLALGQTASQATTGSLVVVGVTSLAGAVTAYRAGNVLLARGVTFGAVAIGGAVLGAHASAAVPEPVLLAAFSALMLVVAGLMTARQLRSRRGRSAGAHADRPRLDDPIITFRPTFMCQCPRALKVLVTATTVGLLTGFLGVGGGFLVVPALVLALALPMGYAAGTSLVVITITSTRGARHSRRHRHRPRLVARRRPHRHRRRRLRRWRPPRRAYRHTPDSQPRSPAWCCSSPPTPLRPPYPPSSDPLIHFVHVRQTVSPRHRNEFRS